MRRTRSFWRRALPPALVLVGLLLAWELTLAILKPPTYLLPTPSRIFLTMAEEWRLLSTLGMNTARKAIIGATIGTVVALVAAALVAPVKWLREGSLAYVAMFQAVPVIVLTPIFNVWFGSGPVSKIAVIAVAVFPGMFISANRGLATSDPRFARLMRSYAAGPLQTFTKVRLREALPSIVTGLKVVATSAMILAIVAELFGGPLDSLGTYMREEALFYRNNTTWAAGFTAVGIGLVFFGAATLLERLVLSWHPSIRSAHSGS